MSKKSEGGDYLGKQKEYCDLYKIDFERVKNLNSRIMPLIETGLGKAAIIALRNAYADVNQNMDYWLNIWRLSNDETNRPKPQEKSLLDLFLYLLLVEGISSKLVEIITFMLMENDHDLYDPTDMKFVAEYSKLDKVSLFVKLQFIEKHGFGLLADAIDRELRNCIAHIDLIVNEDGSIINKRNRKKISNLKQRTDYLGSVGTIILTVMDYSLRKISAIE